MSANRREGAVDNRPPTTREFLCHLKGVKRVKDGQYIAFCPGHDDRHKTRLGDLLNEPDEQIPWLVDKMLPAGAYR
jgi:hypothetical protein